MLKHYLLTAWRNFLRYRFVSLINAFGLSLGLACFIAVIGVYTYIGNADRSLPHAERIVTILQKWTDLQGNLHAPLMSQVSPALAKAMHEEFPDLPIAFVYSDGSVPVVVEGKEIPIDLTIAESDFLKIVDLPRNQAVDGNPLLVPNSAAIFEHEAVKLFGTTAVLGKTLRVRNALDVTITAVLRPISEPSHMVGPYAAYPIAGVVLSKSTYHTAMLTATGKRPRELPMSIEWTTVRFGSATYALLPEDGSLTAIELEEKLKGIDVRTGANPDQTKNEFHVASIGATWLQAMNTNLFQGNTAISIGGMLLTLAMAVMIVACANYANLAFAQARVRAKEIGLRRTIGASRAQVAGQAVADALVHVMLGAAIALVIVAVFGRVLEIQTGFPLLRSVSASIGFWAVLAMIIFVATVIVALYPAITLSRMQPAEAVRAETSIWKNGFGANFMLGAQFVSASTLIIVLAIVHQQERQLRSIALKPGSDVLVTLGYEYRSGGVDAEIWRSELLKSPAIKSVASTSTAPWVNGYSGLYGLHPRGSDEIVNTNATKVSYGFESTLDLTLIAGRAFENEFGDVERSSDAQPTVIVDETLARRLGYNNPVEAIGALVKRAGFNNSDPPVTIVGVVADQPMRVQPSLSFVGTLYTAGKPSSGVPIARIDRAHLAEGIEWIDTTWKKFAPNAPVERSFADEAFTNAFRIYALIGTVLTVVATITLAIALLGAFGFVLFASNRRAHEIGVRKTLGASARQILVMLWRDFSKPIVAANILGWPLAYIAAQRYLSAFEQRIEVTIWPFVFGLAFTLLISSLAIGRQAWRAARLNPADVLRHE